MCEQHLDADKSGGVIVFREAEKQSSFHCCVGEKVVEREREREQAEPLVVS